MPSSLIGNSISQVFFQEATKEKQQTGRAVKIFSSTVKKLIIIGLPCFGVLFFIVEDLFVIVFGEEWRIAGTYAKIVTPLFFIRFISSTLSIVMTSFEKQKIQQGVEEVYTTFINRVSDGRGISTKQVNNIGQGRVWSGYDAKKIGLIDEFGGIEKAIESAAELAELEDYRTISLPKQKDPFTEFLDELNQTKLSDILVNDLDLIKKEDIIAIKELIKSDKIQTRLPYILNLE